MDSVSGISGSKRINEDSVDGSSGSVNNGAKKIRTDTSDNDVSKVVHIRSLPNDVSESEVIQIGLNYGKVTNLLMLKGKNQAFLEMESDAVAKQMVDDCAITPPTIRQRTTYVQYSNHKELKTDNSPGQMKAQAALKAMQQTEGGKNHVLRIVVENMQYPITLDVLHTIFSKFGIVVKTITFNKNNQFQALIQMGDAVQSQAAKLALDGQNIYNGCCTLRIENSKLSSLYVKYNNDKSRDYTRSDLPSGAGAGILGAPGPLLQSNSSLLSSPLQAQLAAVLQQAQLGLPSGRSNSMKNSLRGQMNRSSFNSSMNSFSSMSHQNESSVLLVSNLNEEKITPNILFTLFGVYGDVIRVKILFQKQNTALVQMVDSSQAQTAMRYLHGKNFFDSPLHIVISKHNHVQMPKEDQEGSNLTQDYTNSPLHRFKKPGSKNFQNIFPPTDVLHLSNIPPEVNEEELTEHFSQYGTVKKFKFFPKDRRMALIQLSSLDEAIVCLVMLHDFMLSDTNHLRVSFSKGHI